MAFTGSGSFSLVSGNPVVTGSVISADWANNTLRDIANNGLTLILTRDGQSVPSGPISLGGFRITTAGNAIAGTDVMRVSQAQNFAFNFLRDVSGTNEIIATASIAPSSYPDGSIWLFMPVANATGHARLNISGLGSQPIFWNNTTATVGLIRRGVPLLVQYRSTASNTGFTIIGSSGFLPVGMLAARGELAVGARVNEATSLPTPSDNFVLVADSGTPHGVAWVESLNLPGAVSSSATASFNNLVCGITFNGPWPTTTTSSFNDCIVYGSLSSSATASFNRIAAASYIGPWPTTATASFNRLLITGSLQASATASFNVLNVNVLSTATPSAATITRYAFLAVKIANQANIAIDTETTCAFTTEIYDLNGNNFSTASGVYTAPVTGYYQFDCKLELRGFDLAASHYVLQLKTSNRTYGQIYDMGFFSAAPTQWTFGLHALADMDAGDTAWITLLQASGSAQTDIMGGSTASCISYFSGFRVA